MYFHYSLDKLTNLNKLYGLELLKDRVRLKEQLIGLVKPFDELSGVMEQIVIANLPDETLFPMSSSSLARLNLMRSGSDLKSRSIKLPPI